MEEPFSLSELNAAGTGNLEPARTLLADDGVTLAYRTNLPTSPRRLP